jgi:hypothetical protein
MAIENGHQVVVRTAPTAQMRSKSRKMHLPRPEVAGQLVIPRPQCVKHVVEGVAKDSSAPTENELQVAQPTRKCHAPQEDQECNVRTHSCAMTPLPKFQESGLVALHEGLSICVLQAGKNLPEMRLAKAKLFEELRCCKVVGCFQASV